MDVADALEGMIDAPARHLDQHLLDGLVMVLGVDALGCTELACQLELGRIGVDGDDATRLRLARTLNRREADAAEAEHGDRVSGLDLGGIVDCADAGRDAAAEQADMFGVCLGIDLGERDLATTVYSLKVEQPM